MLKLFVNIWMLSVVSAAFQCPDKGTCEEGQTCCRNPTVGYQCCAFEQAECCEDHVHCCPPHTLCDEIRSSCINASVSIPWIERTSASLPSKPTSFWDEWLRSKLEKQNDEDDDDDDDDDEAKEEISLSTLTEKEIQPLEANNNVPCDDTVSCPDRTTCCKDIDQEWACCPLPKAVCCSDHLHCCPHGQTCDVVKQRCETGQESLPWFEKIPATQKEDVEVKDVEVKDVEVKDVEVKDVEVKDLEVKIVRCNQTAACPDGCTCCRNLYGQWSCCPFPYAVCCSDHLHCCPHGQTCDLVKQRCVYDLESVPWFEKIPAIQRKDVEVKDLELKDVEVKDVEVKDVEVKDVEVKDLEVKDVEVKDVEVKDVEVKDVEVKDVEVKDVEVKDVEVKDVEVKDVEVKDVEVKDVEVKDVEVKDLEVKIVRCNQTAACPDGCTCCRNLYGQWSCCPFPYAVCCSDHLHCCPHGQTCDLVKQRCVYDLESLPWFEKIPAIQRTDVEVKDVEVKDVEVKDVEVKDIPCDSTVSCLDGETCCKLLDGQWGCCPLPQAVCCSDHLHCCPHGQTCNLVKQRCDTGQESLPWFEKIPAIQREDVEVKYVPCDRTNICKDDYTCCLTSHHQWACCPLPQADCCDDHLHCCPSGHRCNLTKMTCESDLESVPWFEKIPAIQRKDVEVKDVEVKDVEVKDVELKDVEVKDVELKDLEVKDVEVKDLEVKDVEVKDIPCDSTVSCPDRHTCCKLLDGQWGCCPLPQAVCCSDHLHCCPHGQTCNLVKQRCDTGQESLPWFEKIPAIQREDVEVKYVPCDRTNICKDDYTCCLTSHHQWACCPLPQADCCDDHLHCCPSGHRCNLTKMTCESDLESVPWFEKIPAIQRKDVELKDVEVKDVEVKDVELKDVEVKDVEVKDVEVKDVEVKDVEVKDVEVKDVEVKDVEVKDVEVKDVEVKDVELKDVELKDVEAESMEDSDGEEDEDDENEKEDEDGEEDEDEKEDEDDRKMGVEVAPWIKCDATTSCPHLTTCCFMEQSHKYGCCPVPNAVCCPGGMFCCPESHHCNMQTRTCVKGDEAIPWFSKIPTLTKAATFQPDHHQCDEESVCPALSTCCRMSEDQWGCCPLHDAVCCSGSTSCCPKGSSCGPEGQCIQKSTLDWSMLKRSPADQKQPDFL